MKQIVWVVEQDGKFTAVCDTLETAQRLFTDTVHAPRNEEFLVWEIFGKNNYGEIRGTMFTTRWFDVNKLHTVKITPVGIFDRDVINELAKR